MLYGFIASSFKTISASRHTVFITQSNCMLVGIGLEICSRYYQTCLCGSAITGCSQRYKEIHHCEKINCNNLSIRSENKSDRRDI